MRVDISKFLAKTLGEDFFEVLAKTELYKPIANMVVDLDDIRIGLKVVPRVVMSLLVRELPVMAIGESKLIPLMLGNNAQMNINKVDADVYSGSIIEDGKIKVSFKYRPLPGVGLVIMSAFELYGIEDLAKEPPKHFIPEAEVNVQKLIDERMAMHHMVGQVVEHKMAEREALQKLLMAKLTEALADAHKKLGQIAELPKINSDTTGNSDEYFRGMTNGCAVAASVATGQEFKGVDAPVKSDILQETAPLRFDPVRNMDSEEARRNKKHSPLKGFLEKKESKKKAEFEFKMVKSEISCPDCKQQIFNGNLFSSCICYGEDFQRKVFIKKSEEAGKYSISFSKGWDIENVQMLVDLLRKKNG